MIITYYGTEFVKVQFGDRVLAFNPVSKDSKNKTTKFGADIALLSLAHPDFNGVEQVTYGEKDPFIAMGPGEYEVKDVFIRGFQTKSNYSGKEMHSTLYMVELEAMHICFAGALSSKDLDNKTLEGIDEVDLLFVPVDGKELLDPTDAYKLAVSLEAKIIIPVHYDDSSLKTFLKEAGEEKIKEQDKLTIKKKDLIGKEGEVIILSPQL